MGFLTDNPTKRLSEIILLAEAIQDWNNSCPEWFKPLRDMGVSVPDLAWGLQRLRDNLLLYRFDETEYNEACANRADCMLVSIDSWFCDKP